ncbi:hypothetical protein GCM10010376_54200 [Streptomyces violaceusniger]
MLGGREADIDGLDIDDTKGHGTRSCGQKGEEKGATPTNMSDVCCGCQRSPGRNLVIVEALSKAVGDTYVPQVRCLRERVWSAGEAPAIVGIVAAGVCTATTLRWAGAPTTPSREERTTDDTHRAIRR